MIQDPCENFVVYSAAPIHKFFLYVCTVMYRELDIRLENHRCKEVSLIYLVLKG